MFFVGATGQLITLILTVGLPFVFLLSGNRDVEAAQHTLRIEAHPVHSEVVSMDIHFSRIDQSGVSEVEEAHVIFCECRTQCLLRENFPGKWKTIYSKSSGNKAPPVIPFFI